LGVCVCGLLSTCVFALSRAFWQAKTTEKTGATSERDRQKEKAFWACLGKWACWQWACWVFMGVLAMGVRLGKKEKFFLSLSLSHPVASRFLSSSGRLVEMVGANKLFGAHGFFWAIIWQKSTTTTDEKPSWGVMGV